MKTSIHLPTLLLTILLIVSVSCKKEKMPDEHKDWNVLEWSVDGERYKAECEGDPLFGCDPVDCQYYHDTKTLEIVGSSLGKSSIYIYIYKHLKLYGQPNYLKKYDVLGSHNSNLEPGCQDLYADTTENYNLIISNIDTIKKIIEGNFNFKALNNCQNSEQITDGYFKLSYRP